MCAKVGRSSILGTRWMTVDRISQLPKRLTRLLRSGGDRFWLEERLLSAMVRGGLAVNADQRFVDQPCIRVIVSDC
jgi:hypothetical protein